MSMMNKIYELQVGCTYFEYKLGRIFWDGFFASETLAIWVINLHNQMQKWKILLFGHANAEQFIFK